MNRVLTVIFGVVLFSLIKDGSVASEDNLDLPKKIIQNLTKEIKKDHMESFPIGEITLEYLLLWFAVRNGYVGNLSSLTLRKGTQKFIKSTFSDQTEYSFDLTVGFNEFRAGADLNLVFRNYFNGSSRIEVFASEDYLRTKGIIYLNKEEQGSCEARLNDVEILELGEINFNAKPENLVSSVLTYIVEVGVNRAIPVTMRYLNHLLSGYIHTLNFQNLFSDFICRSLKISNNLT
uniref:Uncharacterized protein n=1 Tax=Riptortus pedestris TaxID=329032 RepID=R4WQG8_RIPPE|nr:unknown secreted protein [Riptortus pedestris]